MDLGAKLLAGRRRRPGRFAEGRGRLTSAGLVLILALAGCEQPLTRGDYLSPDLRGRVEQLKADVARGPTSAATVEQRARVLWDWLNAYSLTGGTMHVSLPALIARVLAYDATGPTVLRDLDRAVRELQIRDEQPGAIGTLTTDDTGPFPAGSYQTIEQTYTVGEMPMLSGGGVLVARHFMTNAGAYQTDDPAADNYVSIRSSNSDARFVVDSVALGGMHGGFRSPADALVFRLEGASLETGDSFTVTYGDTSGGSNGFRLQTYSNDHFPLPLYVDLQGEGHFLTLPIQAYSVVGLQTYAVHGFAPSVVQTGEPFTVSVRSEDIHYNRATGGYPSYQVTLNGESFAELPASDEAITLMNDLTLAEPGVYRFGFRSPNGRVVGTSNPIWVQEQPAHRIYWGDTHGHSGFAEGQGSADAFMRFGRDDARLDFLTHSEHDIWMDDSEWETLRENVEHYTVPGEFIAFLGYEWTVRASSGGHHNVFFRTPRGRNRVPVQLASVPSELYRRLEIANDLKDVLIIPHAHQAGDWRVSHARMETLVEIMSMHGTFEWFGRAYLSHGHEVGFIAASDDHLSHPGYPTPLATGLAQRGGLAAVLAPEKTTNAIFDALKAKRTYATTGPRIILDVELNDAAMGTRTRFAAERKLRGRVMGTSPIDTITVVKNQEEVWSQDFLSSAEGPAGLVAVSFWSQTDPGMRDNPRGWRSWEGTVNVRGAPLLGASAPSFSNRLTQFASIDPSHPNRVNFRTFTRGSTSTIVLELADAGPGTAIEIDLQPTVEQPTAPSLYRQPARIPGQKLEFRLADLVAGRATLALPVERFEDRVTVRRIVRDAPLDREFEFVDDDAVGQGDNYYVRVTQLDGAVAWSSPIWVGGFSVP
ncbi:MAG: DUF3604 domain-containing protein [Myxococcota bacterium]